MRDEKVEYEKKSRTLIGLGILAIGPFHHWNLFFPLAIGNISLSIFRMRWHETTRDLLLFIPTRGQSEVHRSTAASPPLSGAGHTDPAFYNSLEYIG